MSRFRVPPVVWWSCAGLGAVALLAALGYWWNRGSQARLEVRWLNVRVISTGPESALAVFDLRIHNPARVLFQVKEVEANLIDANGESTSGLVPSQTDLDRVLSYFPLAGPRYTPVLKFQERIRAGETVDRTVAASFSVPAAVLESRRAFELRIQDADGQVTVAREARRAAR
ncbi:MAG: hypothetical protein WHT08_03010 [Bryobacteraceae bacterium]